MNLLESKLKQTEVYKFTEKIYNDLENCDIIDFNIFKKFSSCDCKISLKNNEIKIQIIDEMEFIFKDGNLIEYKGEADFKNKEFEININSKFIELENQLQKQIHY